MSIQFSDIKNGLIVLLIIILLCGVSFLGGRITKPTEIKIHKRIVYKTVYKEKTPTEFNQQNFDLLTSWVNSPIQFKDHTEKNYLFITAFDANKSADARYEIGTFGDWKVYAIIGGLGAIAGGYAVYRLKR